MRSAGSRGRRKRSEETADGLKEELAMTGRGRPRAVARMHG